MEAGWHHLSLIPGIVYLMQFKLFELHVWFYVVDLRLILVEIIDLSCIADKVKIKDEKSRDCWNPAETFPLFYTSTRSSFCPSLPG